MPDVTLVAEPHFMRRTAFRLLFMSKIGGIRVLGFGQYSHETLFFLCCFLYALIELIACGILHLSFFERRGFCFAWREETAMFLLRMLRNCRRRNLCFPR